MSRLWLAADCQRATFAWLIYAAVHVPVAAQTEVGIAYWKGKAPAAPGAITALGNDLFGDRLNLYNGAFHFEQVDVELPGNNALRVALDRQHTPGRQWLVRGAMADWDLNAPRITGYFTAQAGWVPSFGSPSNRCSSFNMPPDVTAGGRIGQDFSPDEYWHGTQLVVPGHGSQEILTRTANLPVPAGQWNLVTRNLWLVGCLPSVINAAGQGFIARSPDGTTYRFNWMASRMLPSLRKGDAVLDMREMALMATEVIDRFGNKVTYTYNAANPWQLERIESSDGRTITLSYMGGRVSQVFDGTRRWQYQYDTNGDLLFVILPDGSRWTFSLRSLVVPSGSVIDDGGSADCDTSPAVLGYQTSGFMIHPSGAKGTFFKNFTLQGRINVERICTYYSGELAKYTNGSVFPRESVVESLDRKVIEGPGMPTLTWTYGIGGPVFGEWAPCTSCPDRKTVEVVEPDGSKTRHTFGIMWRQNDTQLLRVERTDALGNVLSATDHQYRNAVGQAYPHAFGASVRFSTDLVSTLNRPLERRLTTQQGVQFVWQAAAGTAGLDGYARPTRVRKESSLGFLKEETQTYFDSHSLWVLGQPLSLTNHSASGAVPESHTYNTATASRDASFEFGRRIASFAYNLDGTLATVYDAANRPIQLQQFLRGKPQRAIFQDGSVAARVVNNLGDEASYTNEAATTTTFGFDAMGRVASINYPTGDLVAYNRTAQSFTQVWSDEFGLPPGHWRQTLTTGGAVTNRYFDAQWRVRLEQSYDSTDMAGTMKFVETRYDAGGRKSFESYAQRNLILVDQTIPGRRLKYDALNRPTEQRADSELGPLITTTEYLGTFLKRVTNSRGFASSYSFQAFDQPSEEHISSIGLADGSWVTIARDVFSKPTSISRGGSFQGAAQQATRSYVYDAYQRLCKTIEPESGATVQQYDASGNVAWRASGLDLPLVGSCDQGSTPNSRKVGFGYDARDRLASTTFGDGSPDIVRTYTEDGLPRTVVSGGSSWGYSYNQRRLLSAEALLASPFSSTPAVVSHVHNANGHARYLVYADGTTIDHGTNALGQPTQVGNFATGVAYHPNGMVSNYTLGNTRRHTTSLNQRGLPHHRQDDAIFSDAYTYDRNGNVEGISDSQEGTNGRTMAYDALDRLITANGPWGGGSFSYDALDNLRTSVVGTDQLNRYYATATNRLQAMQGRLGAGTVRYFFGYDANGNVTSRGTKEFVFDIGNRLQQATGLASYAYDGHGRRYWIRNADGSWKLQFYSQSGKLLLSWSSGEGQTKHLYLGDKLLAEVNSTSGVSYFHTDVLGSPVAKSNAVGGLVYRTRYEPYGATLVGSTQPAGIGFTGHVSDGGTGLVYMQQRYYDPTGGRFLSVDPVTTDTKTGSSFNRYVYGNNNPYKYKDPDGRFAETLWDIASLALSVNEFRSNPSIGNALGVAVDAAAVIIPGIPGGVGAIRSATSTASSAVQAVKLEKALASEAQTAKILAGKGEAIAGAGTKTEFRDAGRVAAEHGGQAKDWSKVSGGNHVAKDGTKIETHAVENKATGQIQELKTKLKDEGQK